MKCGVLAVLCACCSLLIGVIHATGVTTDESKLDRAIKDLQSAIASSQIKKETKLDPPISFYKQFGVYPSNIRVNFFGEPDLALLRDAFAVFDNNGFVTLWVTSILLETARFSNAPLPTDIQLMDGLRALSTYHDRNRPLNSSVLTFWPQTYNASSQTWTCGPINLNVLVQDSQKLEAYLHNLLDALDLKKLWNLIQPLIGILDSMTQSFAIPADFDDTFVNLGLGALLKHYTSVETFSESYQEWKYENPDISQVKSVLTKYAYRPFSTDLDSNTIDTRTYFYIRQFLHQAQEPLALIPTWVQNISESSGLYKKKFKMPFNINNVDLTVSTNVLYGLTAAVLARLEGSETWFDDPDLQMIYENTSSLLAWEIERNFSNRIDLALTYYPSEYSFYWFTARTVNLLNSADELPNSVMERVRDILTNALRDSATTTIVKSGIQDGEYVYFDGFLGDADKDAFGKPVSHGEDRIYSTAMAVNALLYTWTERGRLVADTPAMVTDTVTRACKWLLENSLSGKYKPYNAFFSGSVKALEELPFGFPANYLSYVNGTAVPADARPTTDVIAGVSGLISEQSYQELLKEKHFGLVPPQVFHGFNQVPFPYWSSQPLTHAATMLALVQYRTLLEGEQ